jgi:hypothetical protein
MNKIIDTNEHYYILDEQHYCCGESQFRYFCKVCDAFAGCYFCDFNYEEPHDCDTIAP